MRLSLGLRRDPRLPAQLRSDLDVGAAAVLAWAPLVGGGAVVATKQALIAGAEGAGRLERPWSDVDHAEFENGDERLAVWWVGGGSAATVFDLERAGRLPEVVHERVRASVLATSQLSFGPRRYASVALRRGPDGVLFTQVSPGPGVRLDDPEVIEAVAGARRTLLEDAGE